MLRRAVLGGVHGVADVHCRDHDLVTREWRGTFIFQADDEPTIARLTTGGLTSFESVFDGERRKLSVTVVSFTPSGLAFFEGREEPDRHS